jgi:hypothetical protein
MYSTELLIAVHVNGMTYSFNRVEEGHSIYGGPFEYSVSGCAFGPERLHQVAFVSTSTLPVVGTSRYYFGLPLIYGFRFDGCDLKYRFSDSEIEVLSISPSKSSDDWPYYNYPALLPYLQIEANTPLAEDWDSFASNFPNLPEEQPAELVAIVPPALQIGHSLWGKGGDSEGVCIVFECDLSTKIVHSYNICS